MNRYFTWQRSLRLLFFLAFILTSRWAAAQCPGPESVTLFSSSPENCPGDAYISLYQVYPAIAAPDVYQFALYNTNGQEIKTWQSDSTFVHVAAGSYEVYIRRVCATGVSDTLKYPVVAYSNYQPVQFRNIYIRDAVNCCNGMLTIDAFAGKNYSLVTSLNAPDIPASYVRPKQLSNVFSGLCAGTYFVRIYDPCDNYQTRSVDINATTRTYSVSTITRKLISCDSFQFSWQISGPYDNGTTWVEWPDGTADTSAVFMNRSPQYGEISGHLSKLSSGYNSSLPFPSSIPNWPVQVKIGFRDVCGVTYRYDAEIAQPGPLEVLIQQSGANRCDSVTYSAYPTYGTWSLYNSWAYTGGNVSYSIDNGATWSQPGSPGTTTTFAIPRGQTYPILFAFCGDTVSQTVSVPPPPLLTATAAQLRGTGCDADISVMANNPTGIVTVAMIQAPPGVSLPQVPTSGSLFSDLPFGAYTFQLKDSSENCVRTTQVSITTEQIPLKVQLLANNMEACKGRARILFAPEDLRGNTVSEGRPIFVRVTAQPAGAGVPASFVLTDWDYNSYFPVQVGNIIPGDYAFEFMDTTGACSRTTSASLSVPPQLMLNTDFTATGTCNGEARITTAGGYGSLGQNGVISPGWFGSAAAFTFRDSLGNLIPAIRTNILYESNGVTTYEYTGLPANTYTIRLELPERDGIQTGCTVTERVFTLGTSALTLTGTRFLAGCAGSAQSATLAANAQGGYGTYTYSLYQGSADPANLLAGPQGSPVFNDLNANVTYVVEVTDECGSATRFTASVAETVIPVYSSSALICPGEDVRLFVNDIPGATYEWAKNGVPLAGQTGHELLLSHVQYPADTGSYQVTITIGGCTLLSNVSHLSINCSPTPVVLAAFKAVAEGRYARLEWQTTSERKNAGFDILRSADGNVWERIGFVASQEKDGTGNRTLSYRFADTDIRAAVYYYRLKQIDLDGKTTLSATRSVQFRGLDWKVYPNPAPQAVTVHGVVAGARVILTSPAGREIRSGLQTTDGIYRMEQIPAGLYILTIHQPGGSTRSARVSVTN